MRQNGHNEDLLENQDWNFYFMLVEVLCFFGIVAFQTNHIMKLLDNKLVIWAEKSGMSDEILS